MRVRLRVVATLALALALAGCEPVRVGLVVHSPNRVEATIAATVDAADRDLAKAALLRLAPGDWDLDERASGDVVRLEMERTLDPKASSTVKVARTNGGFPWVRQSTTISGSMTLPALQPEHLLGKVLADIPLELKVTLPGRVTQVKGGKADGNTATFNAKLSDLVGKDYLYEASSAGWRKGALLVWLVVLITLVWVLWPWIMPPAEVRERRREQRAVAAAKRADSRAARAAEQAERNAKNAEKAAARAAAAEARAERDAAKAAQKAERDAARAAKKGKAPVEPVAPVEPLAAVEDEPKPAKQRRGLFGRRKPAATDVVAPEAVSEATPELSIVPEPEPEVDVEPEPAERTVEPEGAPDGDQTEPSP